MEMLAGDELAPDDPATRPRHRVPRTQLGHLQPERLAGQYRRAHRARLPRRDDPVRPLPRPQVRPDLAGRLLPLACLLRAIPHPDRPRAGSARPHQGGPAAGVRRLPRNTDVPLHPRRRGRARQDAADEPRDPRGSGRRGQDRPSPTLPHCRLSRQARVRRHARRWRRWRIRSPRPARPPTRRATGPTHADKALAAATAADRQADAKVRAAAGMREVLKPAQTAAAMAVEALANAERAARDAREDRDVAKSSLALAEAKTVGLEGGPARRGARRPGCQDERFLGLEPGGPRGPGCPAPARML